MPADPPALLPREFEEARMPAAPLPPADRPDAAERFRTDLAGYLCERTGPELAALLDRLPDQVRADLIMELAGRGPAWLRLPHTWPGHPDQEFMRRRSLREVVADRRAARAARRAGPPPGSTLQDWLQTRLDTTPPARDPGRERRLGEALRGHADARANQQGERTAMDRQDLDLGGPAEPQPPTQGWWDWWLRDDR
jgi:hypothetical protein